MKQPRLQQLFSFQACVKAPFAELELKHPLELLKHPQLDLLKHPFSKLDSQLDLLKHPFSKLNLLKHSLPEPAAPIMELEEELPEFLAHQLKFPIGQLGDPI